MDKDTRYRTGMNIATMVEADSPELASNIRGYARNMLEAETLLEQLLDKNGGQAEET